MPLSCSGALWHRVLYGFQIAGCSGSYLDGYLSLPSWSPGDALFFAWWSCG